VVAASLKFVADRCFASAGNALDQVVPNAHRSIIGVAAGRRPSLWHRAPSGLASFHHDEYS
jgi:hypothetical protein